MPITANFSAAFYERLGHDIAEELVEFLNRLDATYRTDLREMNELNFQRFTANVGQRFAEADLKVEQRFAQLDMKLEQRFARADLKFEQRVGELRAEMAEMRGELRGEFRSAVAQSESKLIRWMFVFWTGSTLTIVGTMLALLKL
jgi:CRP-like cAMP-binding protein